MKTTTFYFLFVLIIFAATEQFATDASSLHSCCIPVAPITADDVLIFYYNYFECVGEYLLINYQLCQIRLNFGIMVAKGVQIPFKSML
jgi:hypothetical protein